MVIKIFETATSERTSKRVWDAETTNYKNRNASVIKMYVIALTHIAHVRLVWHFCRFLWLIIWFMVCRWYMIMTIVAIDRQPHLWTSNLSSIYDHTQTHTHVSLSLWSAMQTIHILFWMIGKIARCQITTSKSLKHACAKMPHTLIEYCSYFCEFVCGLRVRFNISKRG